jgi:hypothetical protein
MSWFDWNVNENRPGRCWPVRTRFIQQMEMSYQYRHIPVRVLVNWLHKVVLLNYSDT